MAVSKDSVTFQCSFPTHAFEAAACRSRTFVSKLPGHVDPQENVTLIIEGDEANFLLPTTLFVACHSRMLRERIREDPAVTEIPLPNSSRAVETLFHLLTHHALSLSWLELEPLCAVIAALDVPSVHTMLRQAANGLLAAADCQGLACVQALLQDFMQLGHQYHLPGLVELGIEKSVSLVPESAQAAHFGAMPAEVQSLMQVHLTLKDRKKALTGREVLKTVGWSATYAIGSCIFHKFLESTLSQYLGSSTNAQIERVTDAKIKVVSSDLEQLKEEVVKLQKGSKTWWSSFFGS